MKSRWPYLAILFLSILCSLLIDQLDGRVQDRYLIVPMLIEMPGAVIYMLVTGDIHGWKPGPIGTAGRIVLMGVGTALFWNGIVYAIRRIRARRMRNETK